MSVERLCSVCEHATTVLRACAAEFRKAGDLTDAAICEVTARALEVELRHVFAGDSDSSESARPPEYLVELQKIMVPVGGRARGTFAAPELVQWLVDTLLEGREHVIALREPAELFATDVETVAQADAWLSKIDSGPPLSKPEKP